jgi:hypothetical protein
MGGTGAIACVPSLPNWPRAVRGWSVRFLALRSTRFGQLSWISPTPLTIPDIQPQEVGPSHEDENASVENNDNFEERATLVRFRPDRRWPKGEEDNEQQREYL